METEIFKDTWKKDILGENAQVKVFIDDIYTSTTVPDPDGHHHHRTVSAMFQRLLEANLTLNFKKLQIARKEVEFLGLLINNKGEVRTAERNIQAIDKIVALDTVKKLKSFLAMASYNSDSVDSRAYIQATSKLNFYLKGRAKDSNAKIMLDEEALYAVEVLKKLLKKNACTHLLNLDPAHDQLTIQADASMAGYAAALLNGQGKVVAYKSRSLNDAGTRYNNVEREACAVIFAVRAFRQFIHAAVRPTVVLTDNTITSYLKSSRVPKLQRFYRELSQLNIVLKHTPGSTIPVPDALSRLVLPGWHGCPDEEESPLNVFGEETVLATLKDDLKDLESDNLLDKCSIIQSVHAELGHLSLEAMWIAFDWSTVGITKDLIKKVIGKCIPCHKRARIKTVTQLNMENEQNWRKLDEIALDFFFPVVNGVTKTCLMAVDRATGKMFVYEKRSKGHTGITNAMRTLFSYVGKPKRILSDRELKSDHMTETLESLGVQVCYLPRHSPNKNYAERAIQTYKNALLKNPKASLLEIQEICNNTPFNFCGRMLKFTPNILFNEFSDNKIRFVNRFRKEQREKRINRQLQLRGRNVTRFDRKMKLQTGKIVKFHAHQSRMVVFGQVERLTLNNSAATVRTAAGRTHEIPAKELEVIDTSFSLKELDRFVNIM